MLNRRQSSMKEYPILMSGPIVRAYLEGRKTQTRRAVKPQPASAQRVAHISLTPPKADGTFEELWWDGVGSPDGRVPHCPYGGPGDRLWFRENFYVHPELWRENHGSQ